MMKPVTGMALGAALVLTVGCMREDMPEAADGQALYAENCALCHGRSGRGDGPLAEGLKRKPSDLTRIARNAGGTFPRAMVLSQIDGYIRGDLPGQNMPEFGALLDGAPVPIDTGDGVMTPTPRPLVALMLYLESLQG